MSAKIVTIVHRHLAELKRMLILRNLAIATSMAFSINGFAAPAVMDVPEMTTHAPHAEESARIRDIHLKRLNERLTLEPKELKERCRYESEISTTTPSKRVVLTFDDGPEPGQTEHILRVLAKYDIHGTFFIIGEKMRQHPDLVRSGLTTAQTAAHDRQGKACPTLGTRRRTRCHAAPDGRLPTCGYYAR